MTPEQLLAGLRDIHLPATGPAAEHVEIVLWPLAGLAVAGLGLGVLLWRRRRYWRRQARRELDRIERIAVAGAAGHGWRRLALLLRRLALRQAGRAPLAQTPVAGLSGERWLRHLDQLFGVDAFTRGVGRGLLRHPYRDADAAAAELRVLIGLLRRRLSRL